jgi:hypothetical protein
MKSCVGFTDEKDLSPWKKCLGFICEFSSLKIILTC